MLPPGARSLAASDLAANIRKSAQAPKRRPAVARGRSSREETGDRAGRTTPVSGLAGRRPSRRRWASSGHSANLDEILVRQRSARKLSELAADRERSKIDADETDPVDEGRHFPLRRVVVA